MGDSDVLDRYWHQSQGRVHKEQEQIHPGQQKRIKTHKVKNRMINWTHVAIGMVVLVFLMMVGVYLFLQNTTAGQRIMARMGRDADAQALWYVA